MRANADHLRGRRYQRSAPGRGLVLTAEVQRIGDRFLRVCAAWAVHRVEAAQRVADGHITVRYRAEPFIGHFLWEYSSHFPDRHSAFSSITSRAPYYMAVNLLRIARNSYICDSYSGRLVAQAKELLRAC